MTAMFIHHIDFRDRVAGTRAKLVWFVSAILIMSSQSTALIGFKAGILSHPSLLQSSISMVL